MHLIPHRALLVNLILAALPAMARAEVSAMRTDLLRAALAPQVESGRMPGLVALVARGDDVYVEAIGTRAFGSDVAMTRDTIFRIASLTKPIVAVAALMLVEDGVFTLDTPVELWLPELADRHVLRSVEGPLDDTVPARRPITVRDLLTFESGYGLLMSFPAQYPIQFALAEAGFAPGPQLPTVGADELLRRYGELPLLHQPGAAWRYNDAANLLGVLIARAAGMSLGEFLQQRLFGPLAMLDTGFSVTAAGIDRLAACYWTDPRSGEVAEFDAVRGGRFARPPVLESGAGGLVSTADDLLAFCRMLLAGGSSGGRRYLSAATVEAMTRNQLSDAQRADPHARALLGEHLGWGLGLAVHLADAAGGPAAGSFGWDGGYGTSAYVDPDAGLIGALMSQRLWDSPEPPPVRRAFWDAAYAMLPERERR